MRSVRLVLALAAVCVASSALAQPLILTVQDEKPFPAPQSPLVAEGPAPVVPAPPQKSVLPPSPRLGPPPASTPSAPPRVHDFDAGPPEASPQRAQDEPPSQSAYPKTQERVAVKPPLVPPLVPPFAGRYSFNRVDDGFLRLDKATGQIGYCTPRATGWGCQTVPENRAGLEKEVARLRAEVATLKKLQGEIAGLKALREEVASLKGLREEVAALKKEIAALRSPPPPRPPAPIPPPSAAPGKDSTMKRPSDQDIAGARAYIAYTWQRLVDMINQLQKDMMGRRESANGLSRT